MARSWTGLVAALAISNAAALPQQRRALVDRATTVTCPGSDGQTVISNGLSFVIECGIDHQAGDMSSLSVSTFQQCIDACSANSACVDVSLSGSACYLKSTLGARVTNGVYGARKVTTTSASSTVATTSKSSTTSTVVKSSTTALTTSTSVKASTTSTTSSSIKTTTTSSSTSIATTSSTSSASTAAAASATPVANSGKRGLAYNQANLTMPFSLSGQNSQVSWAYNWYNQPCSSGATYDGSACGFNPAIKHIPLLFSDDAGAMAAWPAAANRAIAGGAPGLMSFNEPDLCIGGSACMTVNASVAAYKSAMMPFAGKIPIGAPAITNGGSPAGPTYLQNFIGNCTGCQIDFVNMHWYSNIYAGASYFEYMVNQVRAVRDSFPQTKGKPIWITEFGLTNDGAGGYVYTDADLQAFLGKVMPWMDQQPDIARYAYFMDASGILINSAGTDMNANGAVYNSFVNATAQPNL